MEITHILLLQYYELLMLVNLVLEVFLSHLRISQVLTLSDLLPPFIRYLWLP